MYNSHSLYKAAAFFIALLLGCMFPFMSFSPIGTPVSAASVDYPVQLMNIASKNNNAVLTESGTADNSPAVMKSLGGDLSPSWRFDRVGTDGNGTYFKICNAQSGRLLTPKGYSVTAGAQAVVYGYESDKCQHWFVVPVSQDRLGNGLYYKIVNYNDTGLALTRGSNGVTLENYSGADSQLWLLNCDGLQGFAGYCQNDNTGKVKAGDIGGLFGETVEVSNFNDLKKYAESDAPYTILVTNDIRVTNLDLNGDRYMCKAGRIYVRNNKTIIGSYSKHTLFNVQFCTHSTLGKGNNIIIRNFDMQHDKDSNNNDSIVCYFGSGENIWVDHVTFTGHNGYGKSSNGQVDEDKFLACCYDADYCTVSDCYFGAHKYGLILGYPDDSQQSANNYNQFPRMSLISNKFNDCNTRGPGLMRWGFFHSLNNYVNKFSMAYTVISDCDIYAENCVYENGGNVICDWDKVQYIGYYTETGSVFSGCNRTKVGGDSNSTAKASSWKPSGNYTYKALSANDAKNYCSAYSGVQSNNGNVSYLRFSNKGVPSAGFYTRADGSSPQPTEPQPTQPDTPPVTFTEGAAFRFKNVNSGLYMQVEGGNAANGTNVSQWGSDGTELHNIWHLYSAGDGYYNIVSHLGGGKTYALDIAGKKTADGTNAIIYNMSGGENQKFSLTQNSDGSYKIRTMITNGSSCIEVANADKTSGANVQQWTVNGVNCQDWILEPVETIVTAEVTTAVTTTTTTTITTTVTTPEPTEAPTSDYPLIHDLIPGDINVDWKLDITDLVTLQKYLTKQMPYSYDIDNGDINGDHIVNIMDFVILKRTIING